MSHKFESGFVVREEAWHGLAEVLDNPPTIEDGIREAGLDWRVIETPVQAVLEEEDGTPNFIKSAEYKALVRDTDGRILSIVTNHWTPVQNRDAFSWFNPLIEDGTCSLESAGSLRNGRNIWVLAKINGAEENANGEDPVVPYLLLSNSHDVGRALTVAFTPVRVVCWNTLSYAHGRADGDVEKKTKKALKLVHRTNIHDRLSAAREIIDLNRQIFASSMEDYRLMKGKKMGEAEFLTYCEHVYAPERIEKKKELAKIERKLKAKGKNRPDEHEEARLDTRRTELAEELGAKGFLRESQIELLSTIFHEGPGAEMAGQTLWGGYNAITHFEDHHRGRNPETRLQKTWFGAGEKVRDRAGEVAVSMLTK